MRTLKLTQYNTHLFLGTVAEITASYQDAVRLERLRMQLLKSESDIICLNEVWADDSKTKLARGVFTKFPHSYFPSKSSEFKLGSGLLLLSKYPIVKPRFTAYGNLVGADAWSEKGFVQADIMAGTEVLLRLLITHTQSGDTGGDVSARGANFQQIYQAIRTGGGTDGTPTLVVGDLNVIAEFAPGASTNEYKEIERGFAALGFVDFYRTCCGPAASNHGFTYNGLKNKLIPIFAPEDVRLQQRLDYVFLNAAAAHVKLDAAAVSLAYLYSDAEKPQLMDLSDHYPLNFQFSV